MYLNDVLQVCVGWFARHSWNIPQHIWKEKQGLFNPLLGVPPTVVYSITEESCAQGEHRKGRGFLYVQCVILSSVI